MQISQLGYINKFGENIDEEVKAALELLRTSENPTEADLISIQDRQLGHDLTNIFAVEKERCSYGFTRAFVVFVVVYCFEALYYFQSQLVPDLQSGMLRLSCPHLVKSLDRFEFELKGIETINATLSSAARNKSESTLVKSEGQILRENFREINSAWKLIREKFLTETVVGKLYTFLGTTAADAFINSGIIGISPDKIDDVKCLHAHVADYLVRGDNLIGQWALKEMEEKYDVNPKGCKGKFYILNILFCIRLLMRLFK